MSKKSGVSIEKGIPAPTRGTGLTATLRRMKKGDSILWDMGGSERANFYAIARGVFGGSGCIATKKEGDGVYRIWRIK